MKAETHITVGATVGAVIVARMSAARLDYDDLVIVLVAVFCALLPDIDHDASMIGRRAGVFGLPFRLLGHRGFTHSLIAVGLLYLGLTRLDLPQSILIAALAGYVSHLLADALTMQGIALLYPLRWRVHLLPRVLAISTGGRGEHLFASLTFLCLLIVAVPLVVK